MLVILKCGPLDFGVFAEAEERADVIFCSVGSVGWNQIKNITVQMNRETRF